MIQLSIHISILFQVLSHIGYKNIEKNSLHHGSSLLITYSKYFIIINILFLLVGICSSQLVGICSPNLSLSPNHLSSCLNNNQLVLLLLLLKKEVYPHGLEEKKQPWVLKSSPNPSADVSNWEIKPSLRKKRSFQVPKGHSHYHGKDSIPRSYLILSRNGHRPTLKYKPLRSAFLINWLSMQWNIMKLSQLTNSKVLKQNTHTHRGTFENVQCKRYKTRVRPWCNYGKK